MYQIFFVSCGNFLAMHEFSSCGTRCSAAVACGPSHSAACGIRVPQPGTELTPKALQDALLTTGPKGSPCPFYGWENYFSLWETEEWSILSKVNFAVQSLSHVQIFMTPWTTAHQAPLSMGFARQEDWSALPLPSAKETISKLKNLNPNIDNLINCK